MTSDAKIGLLLGLVFIFVIAFIINGLPGFGSKDDSNKLTNSMVGLQNHQAGLGAKERKVQLSLQTPPAQPAVEYASSIEPGADSSAQRFEIVLPDGPSAIVVDSPAASPSLEQPVPGTSQSVVTVDLARPVGPRFYIVQDGDSLSSIAKKFYGELEGNRLVNIKALFEANRDTLDSQDSVFVGQKLVIPPLATSPASTEVLSGPAFQQVDSIGRRHVAAPVEKNTPAIKSGGIYVVQDGDNLWRIAQQRLGDGNRYKEIAKLNSDILHSEDDLQVGMKLKLPTR